MIHQQTLEFRTRDRGMREVTAELQRAVAACGIRTGVATVFLQHTSASMWCNELEFDTPSETSAFPAKTP